MNTQPAFTEQEFLIFLEKNKKSPLLETINNRLHIKGIKDTPWRIGNNVIMCGLIVSLVKINNETYVYESLYSDTMPTGGINGLSQYPIDKAPEKVTSLIKLLLLNQ